MAKRRVARERASVRAKAAGVAPSPPAAARVVPSRTRLDGRALVCLGLALLAVAGGLVLALSQKAQRRAGTNGVFPILQLADAGPGGRMCQDSELVPAGTSALHFLMQAAGRRARVAVTLRHRGAIIARTQTTVRGDRLGSTAPIRSTTRDRDDVEVCLTVRSGTGVALAGGPTPVGTGMLRSEGESAGGSIPISYLRSGEESWWEHASTVVRRMGLGRGSWGGVWVVWAALALVIVSLGLAVWAVLATVVTDRGDGDGDGEEPGGVDADAPLLARLRAGARRVPAVGWSIMAIAVLNAAAWSLITPMFQVPDEDTHVAYVQQLAEVGRPPIAREEAELSQELTTALGVVRFGGQGTHTYRAAVWSPLEQRQLIRAMQAPLSRRGNDDAGAASFEPPLFYALEAIPYWAASGATLLDRIALMRLLCALMAGVTALFAFLFVRECVPGRSWAWTVGGLGVAFTPLLGFVSGGVNPDALLFAVCAATFYCLARAFRRGLTPRLAVWTGVALAIGVLAKINFYGLLPGIIVAIGLAAHATEGRWNRQTVRLVAVPLAIAAAPYALMLLLDALVWERTFILARTPAETPRELGELGSQFSYLWQVYLPRLPGQSVAIPEYAPLYDLWIKGFIGNFGWVVAEYPSWAYRLATVLLAVIAALAVRTLATSRRKTRRRRAELAAYALIAAGLLLLIGLVALRGWAPGIEGAIQGRYLLPILSLFGAILALAARGAGDRWGRAVGVAVVVAAVAWTIFGQLVTIAWFYA